MEFEKFAWEVLTLEQRQEALRFVPPVEDQSMGPAFVECVVAEERENSEFDLKVSLERRRVSGGEGGAVTAMNCIYYIKRCH